MLTVTADTREVAYCTKYLESGGDVTSGVLIRISPAAPLIKSPLS